MVIFELVTGDVTPSSAINRTEVVVPAVTPDVAVSVPFVASDTLAGSAVDAASCVRVSVSPSGSETTSSRFAVPPTPAVQFMGNTPVHSGCEFGGVSPTIETPAMSPTSTSYSCV